MPRVKILYTDYDYNLEESLVKDSLEWEEISEADLKLLIKNQDQLPSYLGYTAKLVIDSGVPQATKPILAKLLEELKVKEAKAEERRKLEASKRREREAKKALKKQETEKKLFEALKQKFEAPT